jgi:hypothetical protein
LIHTDELHGFQASKQSCPARRLRTQHVKQCTDCTCIPSEPCPSLVDDRFLCLAVVGRYSLQKGPLARLVFCLALEMTQTPCLTQVADRITSVHETLNPSPALWILACTCFRDRVVNNHSPPNSGVAISNGTH